MNVLIIEDEVTARAKLKQMLLSIDGSIRIAGESSSVTESIQWLHDNPAPDLAFVDIQLSDDQSFEIFRRYPVKFPVVFTTAYDQFLLESFEYNSIDYLLKPITEEKLRRSVNKISNLREHFLKVQFQQFIDGQKISVPVMRVIVRKGTDFVALEENEIAYFYTEHRVVFVKDFSGRKMIIDQTLADLEERLAKETFFRINRKFLVNAKAIERFKPDNGKVLVSLRPEMKEDIHVSKETAPSFREWIGKKKH
jgi:DNA-binding LytR/AlgR family response regulator